MGIEKEGKEEVVGVRAEKVEEEEEELDEELKDDDAEAGELP